MSRKKIKHTIKITYVIGTVIREKFPPPPELPKPAVRALPVRQLPMPVRRLPPRRK